jgi:hypothetical protein
MIITSTRKNDENPRANSEEKVDPSETSIPVEVSMNADDVATSETFQATNIQINGPLTTF